ncbi:MAG: ABC transporter ATP-binding protein [Stappiaceae bacterium]
MLKQNQPAIVSISGLSKTYKDGHEALKDVSLDIDQGEILALLGPNGAGKTSLISIICGIVKASAGAVQVDGRDIETLYRSCRELIGLVPQEIALEPFEKVKNTVALSRGLFGKPPSPAHIEKVLRQLSLWDKRDAPTTTLSGGMKRRVLIAKALSHEPRILFLDEPTAGVDVELRKEMWSLIKGLKADGVTIILTTHYIEEAEAIADRIGVIDKGRLLLVEEKNALMQRLGRKQMRIELSSPISTLPDALSAYSLEHPDGGNALIYTYQTDDQDVDIPKLLNDIQAAGLHFTDLNTSQSSLEDIFVDLVKGPS